jgi:2-haloacid dehalogenase
MKYKWLMFDADGTLFDYDKAEENALQLTFAQLGHNFTPEYIGAYREINHQIWLEFEQGKIDQITLRARRFELLFDTINIQADAQNFSAQYLLNLATRTDLMAGAEELVRALATKCNLAIITNGLADVQRPRFKQSSIYGYFAAIIISEEVGAAKPTSQIFDVAFAKMEYPAKNEVLIIGDSLTSDIQGGTDYGIDTCWFNPNGKTNGRLACTYEIAQLNQLLPLLKI